MDSRTDQQRAADAVQYLIDSAREIANAKGEMIHAENMLRVVKSTVMKHSDERSAAAQEREAYASEEYKRALADHRAASVEYEKHRALREAAKMQIEYFRSVNANQRAAERGYGAAA